MTYRERYWRDPRAGLPYRVYLYLSFYRCLSRLGDLQDRYQAAYWWNVTLINVFVDNGYRQMDKDKCVLVKRKGNLESYCAITVDDCFFAASRDDEWVNLSVNMLKEAFDELTLERGEVINILGMTVHMERDKRRAVINLSSKSLRLR